MTEQELKSQIQGLLLRYLSAIHAELIHSHDEVFLANKILALIKEAGQDKQAGIREVVEDITKAMDNARIGYALGAVEKCLERWQAKLKGWGISQPSPAEPKEGEA